MRVEFHLIIMPNQNPPDLSAEPSIPGCCCQVSRLGSTETYTPASTVAAKIPREYSPDSRGIPKPFFATTKNLRENPTSWCGGSPKHKRNLSTHLSNQVSLGHADMDFDLITYLQLYSLLAEDVRGPKSSLQ